VPVYDIGRWSLFLVSYIDVRSLLRSDLFEDFDLRVLFVGSLEAPGLVLQRYYRPAIGVTYLPPALRPIYVQPKSWFTGCRRYPVAKFSKRVTR
jgi:hypothetical protein